MSLNTHFNHLSYLTASLFLPSLSVNCISSSITQTFYLLPPLKFFFQDLTLGEGEHEQLLQRMRGKSHCLPLLCVFYLNVTSHFHISICPGLFASGRISYIKVYLHLVLPFFCCRWEKPCQSSPSLPST